MYSILNSELMNLLANLGLYKNFFCAKHVLTGEHMQELFGDFNWEAVYRTGTILPIDIRTNKADSSIDRGPFSSSRSVLIFMFVAG